MVYGNYRLLGEYLGPRRYYRREAQSPTLLPLPDLPPEIFGNEPIRNLLIESEREAALSIFNKNEAEGFRYLSKLKGSAQHPLQVEFIEELERYFHEVQNFSVPGFKSEIPGSQKDMLGTTDIKLSTFPAFHQNEYAYRFTHKPIGPVDYLAGATGTMKSGAAQFALKAAGANSPIIVCPSGINKLGWTRELREKLEEPARILTIDSVSQLRSLARNAPRTRPDYTIIGYQLLSRLNVTESPALLEQLRDNLGWDGLCADEVHLAKEPTAECTQQLYILSRLLPQDAPRITMTASPIVNSVEDLDAPVRTLLPYRYPNRGDFTRAARNDPDLVSALLRGEQILTRWTKEGLLELPPVEHQHIPVPLTPFHQQLYDHIYFDETIEAQVKRGMLRQVSLDPFLIRRHYNPNGIAELAGVLRSRLANRQDDIGRRIIEEKIRALETRLNAVSALSNRSSALQDIRSAHEMFKQLRNMPGQEDVFDEDFLTRMGFGNAALWAFFNLRGGVDEVIRESADLSIRSDWVGKSEVISSKYLKLKEILDERILNGKTKAIVYSGFYQVGVSTGVEDMAGDDELAFLSLYDHLRSWYGDSSFLKIDGSISIEPKGSELAEREKVRRKWRLDPTKNLLATIRSARLGIDLSVPKTDSNKNIEKVSIIFVDFPDTYMDIDQSIGRAYRPGQDFPLEVLFLRTTNPEQPITLRYGYIDHGMWEAIEYKRLLSQAVIDGVPLTEEEEASLKSHMTNVPMDLLPSTPNYYLTNVFYRQVRGQGARRVLEYYQQGGFEGVTNADFFAANYPLHDQLSIAGHNARAVSEIIKVFERTTQNEAKSIGSVGAGAGTFQLILGRPVVNIDILPEILEIAKDRLNNQGSFVVGEASQLPIKSDAFDFTDASFMLHWTNNRPSTQDDGSITSERARVILELNRVTKAGGMVVITLPPSYLTIQQFSVWKEALQNDFGFKVREDVRSGLMHATDFRQEPVSWIFNLEKVARVRPRLQNVTNLSFDFEGIFGTIGTRSGTRGSDPSIASPSLPHSEFEIVEPGTGLTQRLSYSQDPGDIENFILSQPVLPNDIEILVRLGSEEFGMYRRAIREAKNKWGLNSQDAQQLALEALNLWSTNGNQQDNSQKIWTEIRDIMEEIRKEQNK